ncbi:10748_t:CDS:2, partial [Dentiscutata heterogama]
GLSTILENEIANHRDIPFMAIKNKRSTEKINRTYRYVLHLYKHMKNRNERIPDPGKWFSYVVIKGPPLYNEQDRKILHRVGDYMEYMNIAKE